MSIKYDGSLFTLKKMSSFIADKFPTNMVTCTSGFDDRVYIKVGKNRLNVGIGQAVDVVDCKLVIV